MSLKIALNNPMFELKPVIQDISSSFLKTFGLNYFQYLRCYEDGSFSMLSNNLDLVEYFTEAVSNSPVIFSSFEKSQQDLHSYWFLWDEKLPSEPVCLARERCNLHHGITWVRRSKNYYDMIAVALPEERSDPGSYYLSITKAIESFICSFDQNNNSLIELMDKHKIALPSAYRDKNYQEICIAEGKIPIRGKYGSSYLTTQELACLRWILQGLSYKQTARFLKISPRTVETYIHRIKEKTGYMSQSELYALMYF